VLEDSTKTNIDHPTLTLLELLEALEGDFELVRGGERRRVVEVFHPE
jgi:predicted ATPase